MTESELGAEHVRTAVEELALDVRENFRDIVLARLWAVEQLRRAAEKYLDELLVEARGSQPASHRGTRTWEEIGTVLGMSAQGARQRALRRREPVDLRNRPSSSRAERPSGGVLSRGQDAGVGQ